MNVEQDCKPKSSQFNESCTLISQFVGGKVRRKVSRRLCAYGLHKSIRCLCVWLCGRTCCTLVICKARAIAQTQRNIIAVYWYMQATCRASQSHPKHRPNSVGQRRVRGTVSLLLRSRRRRSRASHACVWRATAVARRICEARACAECIELSRRQGVPACHSLSHGEHAYCRQAFCFRFC